MVPQRHRGRRFRPEISARGGLIYGATPARRKAQDNTRAGRTGEDRSDDLQMCSGSAGLGNSAEGTYPASAADSDRRGDEYVRRDGRTAVPEGAEGAAHDSATIRRYMKMTEC